jgi:hypothetical protein
MELANEAQCLAGCLAWRGTLSSDHLQRAQRDQSLGKLGQ